MTKELSIESYFQQDWNLIKIRKKPQVSGFRLFEYWLLRLGRKFL